MHPLPDKPAFTLKQPAIFLTWGEYRYLDRTRYGREAETGQKTFLEFLQRQVTFNDDGVRIYREG